LKRADVYALENLSSKYSKKRFFSSLSCIGNTICNPGILDTPPILEMILNYFKNKQDTKFRELALIAVIGILILAGSKIEGLQSSKNSENQYSGALRFVETIAQDLHVNKEDVYINTEAATDGAIVKVGDQFYRVLTGDSPEHYLLEKMELQNPKVTIKEAE